ncbi:hypothetical protein GPJ56_010331 [Histomonas meleagridis]|uniref:uncharacterized protein n=1 Tax=Histomonas meleagridis TaxID=135588 RepID=UPI00355A0238|nr:hypothetical protein GPJ56_010331 [Histomonas meleagridis]KAH0797938.1 hypothetical protein GO595_009567 [Histomonas meleagridis]
MFCSTNKKNLQIVGNNNKFKNIVEKILSIINAGEKALHIKNEKEKLLKLQNSIAPILNEFNEDPIPQKEFEINNKLNEVLFDWFKVLFWKIFPEEAENFGLQIKSFEMPKKYEIEVGNKEVNEDENEDKNIEIVPKEKSEVKTEFERFLEEQIAAEEENESENGENEIAQNDILSEQIPNPFGEDDELSKFLDEK